MKQYHFQCNITTNFSCPRSCINEFDRSMKINSILSDSSICTFYNSSGYHADIHTLLRRNREQNIKKTTNKMFDRSNINKSLKLWLSIH